MEAYEYFGGLTKIALTDRMKRVLLEMEENKPRWNPRFATQERKVTWDGYVSYDGVLYGLPSTLQLAGKQVQVRERKGVLSVWSAGMQVFEIAKRPRSQDSVPHPDQWKTIASVSAQRRTPTPLGHLQPAPDVERRPLQEYDQDCGIETVQEVFA